MGNEKNTPQTEAAKVEENSSADTRISTIDKTKNVFKRKNKLQPVYAVLSKARKQFDRQVDKNTETKIKCIEANIAVYYPDPLRFWLDLKTEADVLLDSKRFCFECESKKANPRYVAEHLVFEGKKVVEKVRKEGVINYGENIVKFNGPLFIDKEKLYSQEVSEQLSSELEPDNGKEE